MTTKTQPRLIPFFAIALGLFAILKLSGFVVAVSTAQAQSGAVEQATSEHVEERQAAGAAVDVRSPPELAPGEVERRILERLAARRSALDEREKELALRKSVIAAAEAKLAREFAALERERAEITALREERDAASSEEVEALVSAYERMKSRDAAAIFNELDEKIMLAVASKMRTQALAGVLSDMEPSKARSLTVLLAERGRILDDDASGAAGQ